MSGGGNKRSSSRLLPPIKNPLFNPNEHSDDVRITTVRSPPDKTRSSRLNGLTSFFTTRNRNLRSSPDSLSSNRDETSPSASPANSRRGSATVREHSVTNPKDLPLLSRDLTQRGKKSDLGEGKPRTVFLSKRFARNLASDDTEENVNKTASLVAQEKNGIENTEKVNFEPERKTAGLLRREKEKRSLLEATEASNNHHHTHSVQPEKVRSISSNCESPCTGQGAEHRRISSSLERTSDVEQIRYQDALSLRNDWRSAKVTGDYGVLVSFLTHTFDSFSEIGTVFKKREDSYNCEDLHESAIDYDFVRITFDIVLSLPQELQKTVLKSVINSLLQDLKRQRSKDDLRAYMILLQNPQFNNAATYVIFAHLLRQVSSLTDSEHQFLVHWFRRIPLNTFKALVTKINQFISVRMFPCKANELPPEEKCRWWIPSAVKVLALLNAANWLFSPPMVSHVFFYNHALDHIELMGEYYSWQNPTQNQGKFSFCQYPFILSLAAKRYIMQKDSESQMIVMARKSLVEKVQRRQMPDMGMLFLNIRVRRSHLISDSLNEVTRKQRDLKKKLKVTFAGEPGLDMGGLTKEWFLLLIRRIFRPEYGMFTYNEKSRYFWFSNSCVDNDSEFNLVGVLMGLAVYNSIILDIHFPPSCYKKLLSPAVVPYQNPSASVGVASVGLEDLTEAMPDLAHGLKELLAYDGNVEEDLCQTFQMSYSQFGEVVTHNLKRNGDKIPVTNENREEYVGLYVDFLLNKSIYQQFASFYHGFHSVCASNALIMLRPEEVEMLVCGNPELDMEALKKVTVYDGYTKNEGTIRYFWDVVMGFSADLKKKLLLFATGSDRVPIGGMGEMEFKIVRMDIAHSTSMLPMAHTCFNQLCLPPYKSRRILKHKLTIAISNAEGFGIE